MHGYKLHSLSNSIIEMAGGLPSLCDSSQFDLLGPLYSKGFTNVVHFPRSVQGRVCKALGAGLLKHFDIRYPQIDSFLDKTWKKLKVPKLVTVKNGFQGDMKACCRDKKFWEALEEAVKQTICELLPEDKKKALIERGDINPDHHEFINRVAEILLLTIIILRTCENGFKQSVVMPGAQHVGLIVVLVQAREDLFLMLHEGLEQATGKSGVPYYYRSEDSIPIPVLLENSYQPDASSSDSHRKEQIISEKKANLTLALTKFSVTVATHSPEYRALLVESVLPAIRELDNVSAYAQGTFPFHADLLQLKELLQAPAATSAADTHSPIDCYKYYTTAQYAETTCCGGRVHVYCLNQWAESCCEETGPDSVCTVTCPLCRSELPESLLEQHSPAVYEKLQERKRQVCLRASAPVSAAQNYSYASDTHPSSLYTSFTCLSCNQSGSTVWLYTSRNCTCNVCLACGRGQTQCVGCRRNYSTYEISYIESSYQALQPSS